MTRRLGLRAVLLIAAVSGFVAAQGAAQKIELKVLYAGVLKDPRTEDFKEFLSKAFTEVGTVELRSLGAAAAKPFDVVIVDSPTPYGSGPETGGVGTAFKIPETAELTTAFTKPTILMGAAGGKVLGDLRIKLTWL